ncbi:MAG: phytanoyl-CoA dioxygenase family protein [Pseudomonadota bacterium]
MKIPHFTAKTDFNLLQEALDEAGCLVVTGAFDAARCEAIRAELAPHMERARVTEQDDPEAFYPGLTRRVSALLARSRTVTDQLVLHPVTKKVCDAFLLPNGEFGYQLHVTAALEVGPGARKQVLHREEDSLTYFSLPRPNMIAASMWAVSDFRADNGATLVVPGSHKWPADRVAQDSEILSAEMPAGSVFYWLGGLLHGAGANSSQGWRYGVILTYSVGWIRQEENQYLDVPPERLAELSPEIRRVAGFDMYRALGFYDPTVAAR